MMNILASARSEWLSLALPNVTQLRIASGLVLFAFAVTHFINHGLGLVSIEAMAWAQEYRKLVTRSVPGTVLLAGAAGIHFVLGISRFLGSKTWRVGWRNIVQLAFGLLIPVFLLRHILGTRGVHELFGIEDSYAYALWAMWPYEALNQAFLMTLVWVHGCIGLHHWLMLKPWYRGSLWLWYGLAVLIPALGYAGFTNYANDYYRLFTPGYAVSAWTDRVSGFVDIGYGGAVDGWTAATYYMPRIRGRHRDSSPDLTVMPTFRAHPELQQNPTFTQPN